MDLKTKVVLVDGKIRSAAFELLKDQVILHHQQERKFTPEEFDHYLAEAEGIYAARNLKIDEAFLAKAPQLKIIAQGTVGYDNIDLMACAKRGIKVSSTPGVSAEAVADIAYGLLLDCCRRFSQATAFVRNGQWGVPKAFGLTTDLAGKTLGIVGFGIIGKCIARRALASKMHIIYSDPMKAEDEQKYQAQQVDLPTLLKTADYVLLACTLNKGTLHLINKETLSMMKPTACLINICRGKVVNNEALYNALKDGKIAYAAMDVVDGEPLKADHPLLTLPNITVTPHIGSATKETRDAMAILTVQNLLAGLAEKPLLTPVPMPKL